MHGNPFLSPKRPISHVYKSVAEPGFPRRWWGASPEDGNDNLLFCQNFYKNWMKMKEIGMRPVPPCSFWIFQCTCDQTSCTRSHIALLPVINSSNDSPSKSNLSGFLAQVQIVELKTWKSWAFRLEGYTTRSCEPAATSDGVLCDICCPLESSV